MSIVGQTEKIRDICAAELPALIATASLTAIAKFRNESPEDYKNIELCVYPDTDNDMTDERSVSFIIMLQLYGEDKTKEYHDVIFPFLKKKITPDFLGHETRLGIKTNFLPIDRDGNSSFVFYVIDFKTSLDDCEDS